MVFRIMFNSIYVNRMEKDDHMISFCIFDSCDYSRVLRAYFLQKTTMSLYQVYDKDHEEEVSSIGELPPSFEMVIH